MDPYGYQHQQVMDDRRYASGMVGGGGPMHSGVKEEEMEVSLFFLFAFLSLVSSFVVADLIGSSSFFQPFPGLQLGIRTTSG